MQQDGSVEPTPLTDMLNVMELSDDFLRLLGVDRRSAEALEPVFAARCDQLLPVDAGSDGIIADGDKMQEGLHRPITTRLAPRAVLLTRQGSLFLLKNRGGRSGVIMERLEVGAYLPLAKKNAHSGSGDSAGQGFPPLRIDVTVNERPFSNGMQAMCITGWTHSTKKEEGKRRNRTCSVKARHMPRSEGRMWLDNAGKRECSPAFSISSPSLRHVTPHETKEVVCLWRVLALQFCARGGLLASLLAVKIKQIAAFFGNSDVMRFNVSSSDTAFHLARQLMMHCTLSSALPCEAYEISWSVPRPLRHCSLAVHNLGRVALNMLEPRITMRDVIIKGMDEPVILSRLQHGLMEAHESGSLSSSSSLLLLSSLDSSLSSSNRTVDAETERAAELAERREAKRWKDTIVAEIAGDDDDAFAARLTEVLNDISSSGRLLRASRMRKTV